MNTLECLLKAEEKGIKTGIGKIVHELWIEKRIWHIHENNLMNQIRMIKSKGWLANVEIETIRRKIDNKDRDKENNGTLEKNDERADINVENVGIDHTEIVNEVPNVIRDGNDLTNTERDRLLKMAHALEDNGLDKGFNLKYTDKEKLREEVIKINKHHIV